MLEQFEGETGKRTAYDHGGDEKQVNLSNGARCDDGIN